MKVKLLKSAALTAFLAASLTLAHANTAPVTTQAPQGGAGGCATGSSLVDGQCVVTTTTVAPVAVAQAQEQESSVPTEGADPVAPTAASEEADTVTMLVGDFERQVAEVEAALAKQLEASKPEATAPEVPNTSKSEVTEENNNQEKDSNGSKEETEHKAENTESTDQEPKTGLTETTGKDESTGNNNEKGDEVETVEGKQPHVEKQTLPDADPEHSEDGTEHQAGEKDGLNKPDEEKSSLPKDEELGEHGKGGTSGAEEHHPVTDVQPQPDSQTQAGSNPVQTEDNTVQDEGGSGAGKAGSNGDGITDQEQPEGKARVPTADGEGDSSRPNGQSDVSGGSSAESGGGAGVGGDGAGGGVENNQPAAGPSEVSEDQNNDKGAKGETELNEKEAPEPVLESERGDSQENHQSTVSSGLDHQESGAGPARATEEEEEAEEEEEEEETDDDEE